ncbi:MAG: hypothetical protein EXS36_20630 [Pedosphaera sp.]|nr:hypothetical protein [Pedosphaera sp.]
MRRSQPKRRGVSLPAALHDAIALTKPLETSVKFWSAPAPAALFPVTVTNTPTVTTNERSVQLPLTGNAKFFRLRRL